MILFEVLDIFSGIGGMSLGLERTGFFKTRAFCEIDPHCRKVLKKHWPDIPVHKDVKTLKADTILPDKKTRLGDAVKVICGGFPCQDISIAGGKKGIKGERSGLWKEYKRLISEIRPDYAIIENVGNLRHKGLAVVLKDLWKLGYDAEWYIISAKSVGAWHERKRVWIIAFPNDNDFRLGIEAFAPKKEKQEWWAKTTAKLRSWWPSKPSFCGTVDGVRKGLDEDLRQERIKQLGNAVVPQIPELIGNLIAQHEIKRRNIDVNQISFLEAK